MTDRHLPPGLSPTFSPAQRAALVGLLRCGGTMVVEIFDGDELNIDAAAAVGCLGECVRAGYATHEQGDESAGKYSLTRLGRSAAEFLDALARNA